MNSLAVSYFAQAIAPTVPLPQGPVLRLPAGDLDVLERGRIFSVQHLVVAVGISERVFLVVEERDGRLMSPRLLDQLVGYFIACGCEVARLAFRCPLRWHHLGNLDATIATWGLAYLDAGHAEQWFVVVLQEMRLNLSLPLRDVAANGVKFWDASLLVADAIAPFHVTSMRRVRSALIRFSHDWEHGWNQHLVRAHLDRTTTFEDWAAARECDLAWTALVRAHLEPHGYRMQPASVARLL